MEGLLLPRQDLQCGATGYGEEKGVLNKPGTWIIYRSVFTPLETVCPPKNIGSAKRLRQ